MIWTEAASASWGPIPIRVKSCKRGGGFYMTHPLGLNLVKRVVGSIGPPTWVKTCKNGGGFYMSPQLGLKLVKRVVGSI